MIKVLFRSIVIIVFASLICLAQSGRKITPQPTPSPVSVDDASGYSESRSQNRRIRIPQQAAESQTDTNNPPTNGEEEIVRIVTNLITIPISVFDRDGLYIPGLQQSNFKIFEDGVEQEIAYFGTTDKPFTVALVLDTSPSTQYKIDEIHKAAIAFVDLLKPQDSVIVIEFHSSVKVQTEATRDRSKIYKAIYKAEFGGGTSLYNAVDEAIRKQLGKIEGRKAVVLFTDGVDTTSRKNSYDSTLNYAEESDSLIFPIYYNTYLENRQRSTGGFPDIFLGGPPPGTTAAEYALGRKYLDELADATGGRVFRPESTPGGLTRAFEGIAEELRRQYNIGYIPKEEGKPGQRKQIKVRVNRPNLIIRARDSYIVGATKTLGVPKDLDKR